MMTKANVQNVTLYSLINTITTVDVYNNVHSNIMLKAIPTSVKVVIRGVTHVEVVVKVNV